MSFAASSGSIKPRPCSHHPDSWLPDFSFLGKEAACSMETAPALEQDNLNPKPAFATYQQVTPPRWASEFPCVKWEMALAFRYFCED